VNGDCRWQIGSHTPGSTSDFGQNEASDDRSDEGAATGWGESIGTSSIGLSAVASVPLSARVSVTIAATQTTNTIHAHPRRHWHQGQCHPYVAGSIACASCVPVAPGTVHGPNWWAAVIGSTPLSMAPLTYSCCN
jgi:hypothetical protein